MKTTLELPNELMRAIKVQAAATDRKLKDVVAEVIARGLESLMTRPKAVPAKPAKPKQGGKPGKPGGAAGAYGRPISADALVAIFAAGDEMARQGVDFKAWAAKSREVWR